MRSLANGHDRSQGGRLAERRTGWEHGWLLLFPRSVIMLTGRDHTAAPGKMPPPSLYIARLLPEPVMATARERFHLTVLPKASPPSRDALLEGLRQAQAAICTLTEHLDQEILSQAPRLRVIANYAVGYNNIVLEAARARGIVVTNTPDVLTETTADLTWALLLATARRVAEGDRLVREGAWQGSPRSCWARTWKARRSGSSAWAGLDGPWHDGPAGST